MFAKRKDILKEKMSAPSDAEELLADCPLEEREEEILLSATSRECLPTLSDTRWLSRVDSISTLLVNYSRIYDAISEVMMQSTGKASHDASAFLRAMEQFHFIVSAVLTQYILGYTRPLSVLLQSKSCDLIKAHDEARNLLSVLNGVRQSEEKFKILFERATTVAQTIDVLPSKPRTAGRQVHRANARAESIDDFYRLNYFYPFLDHIIRHMEERFPKDLRGALLGSLLIPANLDKLTQSEESKIKSEFNKELPMPHSFEQEVIRWKETQKKKQERQFTYGVCFMLRQHSLSKHLNYPTTYSQSTCRKLLM